MIIQSPARGTISINTILSESLQEATLEYKKAKERLRLANNGKASKSYAMKKLNIARAKLQRIAKATYNFYYNR